MKTIAKITFCLMAAAAICVGFSSCGGDDDFDAKSVNKTIVGTWKCTLNYE